MYRPSFRERFSDYLLQVSLIVLGLVVATGVDRCNTQRKEGRRLQEYYAAIRTDLEAEIRSNQMNIGDARRDVASLENAIRLFSNEHPDSLVLGLKEVMDVLGKGVFRTFSPTTFDVMVNNGDISLIKDLKLRSNLAAVFSFRTNIIEQDLVDYDRQVLETLTQMGGKVDLRCILDFEASIDCIKSAKKLIDNGSDELVVLQFAARSRLFHLTMALQRVEAIVPKIDSVLQLR